MCGHIADATNALKHLIAAVNPIEIYSNAIRRNAHKWFGVWPHLGWAANCKLNWNLTSSTNSVILTKLSSGTKLLLFRHCGVPLIGLSDKSHLLTKWCLITALHFVIPFSVTMVQTREILDNHLQIRWTLSNVIFKPFYRCSEISFLSHTLIHY